MELLDWRRRVAELFVELRRREATAETLAWFRAEKDALFRSHPQSPLPRAERAGFSGLQYWPFDAGARVAAHFTADTPDLPPGSDPLPPTPLSRSRERGARGPRRGMGAADAGDERREPGEANQPLAPPEPREPGEIDFFRIGWLNFELARQPLRLPAYWIAGYAGGLFVPFRDATSGRETYGGGRYLIDSIKSADLGSDLASATVVLDFNYAYHPSCAYDPRWVCPLARPESRLPLPVRAGERLA